MKTQNFENDLQHAAGAFDVFIKKYMEIIQRQQFDINTLVTLEDNGSGVIDLSHRVGQQVLFEKIFFSVPNATTSAVLTLGRYSITIDNPATIVVIQPVQYILGSGDIIKLTWTPAGGHLGYFAIFGRNTGGNLQL